MRIKCLASSSAGNGYYLENSDGYGFLVEAGASAKAYAPHLDAGVCFVTHSHGDHSKTAEHLDDLGLDIVATAETLKAIDVDGVDIETMQWIHINGVDFLAFPTDHDCTGSVGWIFDFGDDVIMFATDTNTLRYNPHGVTHLMVECNHDLDTVDMTDAHVQRAVKTHFSLQSLIEFLKTFDKSDLREIYLMHLSDSVDEDKCRREVEKATGVPVYICNKNGGIK